MNNLLEIKNLYVSFFTDYGEVKAVRDIDIEIKPSEVVGLVGESGCGKSVTALSILNLVPLPGKIISGEIIFKHKNLLELSDEKIREIRGREISMIFQEPMSSLNPVFKIGDQIAEVFRFHTLMDENEIKKEVINLLDSVKIPDAKNIYNYYPHQLSGGMQQRVMIAMAIALKPLLLIADEPTTALDVTVEAQILNLLMELKNLHNLSILFITHDLAVISEIADRIYVMYAGEIMEFASKKELFENPQHPYTKALFEAIPGYRGNYKKLHSIPGSIPDNINLPEGCVFHPRCKFAKKECKTGKIKLKKKGKSHFSRCIL